MGLTNAERKLAATLLERAADEFSNHGCNDFELLTESGLTREEAFEIASAVSKYQGDDGLIAPESKHLYTHDWLLMRMLARKILEE